jgi:hypothetical protein
MDIRSVLNLRLMSIGIKIGLMGASIDTNISPSYFGSLEGNNYITDVQ